MGIYVSDAELNILAECSGLAVKAYLRLRRRMDLRTRLVGVMSGLSWQALVEWTETVIPKGAGATVEKPTLAALRRAVDALERRGLLQKRKCATLVFLLPLASTPEIRPKHTRQEPGRVLSTEPGSDETEKDSINTGVCVDFAVVPGNASEAPEWPNPAHIRDQRFTGQQSSSTTGREEAAGDDATAGVNRDRPSGSQAGSLGRPGKTHEDPDRDRPTASHPAHGRRSGAGADADGACLHPHQPTGARSPAEKESFAVGMPHQLASLALLSAVLRARGVRVRDDDSQLVEWVAEGVTPDELAMALERAREARLKAASIQPINLPYLKSIIQSDRSAAGRALRRLRGDAPRASRGGTRDLEVLAARVGVVARAGESWEAFGTRVLAAAERGGVDDAS